MLGAVETRGYRDFDALLAAVSAGEVAYGLLPCENTIYGSIARSYDLLLEHRGVAIVDETSHRIVQCLIGTKDATLEGVARVRSHPVALGQCRRFLATFPSWRAEAAEDTAGAVREIAEAGDAATAAIGPALAAQKYGAKVLADAIADEPENITRFFLLARSPQPRRNLGRACVAFHLPHRAGTLHAALAGFARHGLNLRNLVVRPRRGYPFEYSFYVELETSADAPASALDDGLPPGARVLGRY